MRRFFFVSLALLSLAMPSTVKAQGRWVDMTDSYLTNPSFEQNNRNGWTTNTDAVGTNVRLGAAEFWNSNYFDTYQTVTLPAGSYRLSVRAFYRDSGETNWEGYQNYLEGNYNPLAVLYAGKAEKPIVSLYSFVTTDYINYFRLIGEQDEEGNYLSYHFVANNMEGGVLAFEQPGVYENVLEFESDGVNPIRLGVKKDTGIHEDWFMYDNFILEQYITGGVLVGKITVTPSAPVLAVGESIQLSATVLPVQADNTWVTWSCSPSSVAVVSQDGTVSAVGKGTATVTVTARDGSGVTGTAQITVIEGGLEWVDVTDAYIENPNFDNNSVQGWSYTGGGHDTQYNCHEVFQQAFDFWQEFEGIPNGRYRFSAQAFYRTGANSENRCKAGWAGTDVPQAVIYGNATSQPLLNLYTIQPTNQFSGGDWTYFDMSTWTRYFYPNNMEGASVAFGRDYYWQSVEVYVTDGHLRVGIMSPNYADAAWCIFDSFRLEYYGDVTPPSGITVEPTNAALVFGESIQLTATVKPKDATFRKVYWESDDEAIATVDVNGLVTAQTTAGTVNIYAITYDGNYDAVCTVKVSSPAASKDQYVINEIMSGNIEQFIDDSYNFGGWIELYNPTDKAASLAGFYLSDDATNLTKWHMPATMGVVPAHGYRVIWFDHNSAKHPQQAPFKLDCDGGTIYLSDADGNLIVGQTYDEVISRMSYARTTDGGTFWDYTAEPTPGASNNNSEYTDEQLERPYVDKNGQLFEGTLNISVTIPEGATLRYTTNGSLPTLENGKTSETGFFSISETTVFRFRLFQDGYLPSEVATRTYLLKDRDYTLPIISVVTDSAMLYDNTIGCYVAGTNGMRGRGQSSPRNYNQDWERPVSFEYLVDGEAVLNQEVTFSTCGGWSRGWAPASFKLKGNKKFGTSISNDPVISHQKTLDYPFFKDKPYIRNRTLQNRNAGNDIENNKAGRMTDAVVQRIALTSGIDIDGQSAEPILYFINGKVSKYPDRGYNYHPDGYINLNMREPNNKHYVYANYGWDDEEIDIWEMDVDSGYVQMCGDRQAFEELYDLCGSASDPVAYERIRQLLDIEEFQNYMAVYIYSGSTDWPHNNTKAFRNRQDGRFRWILFDMDWTFRATDNAFTRLDGYYKTPYGFYPLYDVYDENGKKIDKYNKEVEYVAIFRDLLQNDEFRKQFIDRFCIVGGSVYEPNRVEQIITEFAERKKDMLVYDGLPNSMDHAQDLINGFKDREPKMTNALKNYRYMQLSGISPSDVELSVSDKAGTLYINDIEVPQDYFKGHLFYPVTLRAEAPAGYRFQGWMDMSGNLSDTKTLFGMGDYWTYYDQGSLDNSGWQTPDYSSSDWSVGAAPFGFGNSGKPMSNATTTLDWGTDSRNKRTTYYLRREFVLDQEPADGDVFTLNYQVDDGMLVWVNGSEAASFHVPSGADYSFYTNQDNNWYVGDDPSTGSFVIDNSLLHKGTNIIAVEVHNCNGTSSDLWWDASLTYVRASDGAGMIVSTDEEFEMPYGESLNLKAVFENMSDEERAAANIAPIRINEVSAANSIYVDDYYTKHDWVELYNTTDQDIDIEGMYLTDNKDKPTKWKITKGTSMASTIVPAHGFLLVWCDKNAPIRQLHADFKLAAEGGIVRIQSADGSWSDMLRYPAHNGDQTVGRYPNGCDSVYVMTVPTIEKSNIKNSYMTWTKQEEDGPATSVEDTYISSNNGLRIFFNGSQLAVRSEETRSATITIYTLSGQRVLQTAVTFQGGAADIGLSPLMPGQTYVARATDNEGNQCSVKFLYR